MKLFVADIGGTEIKYSVMDTDLVIYAKGNVQTPQNSLNSLLDLLQELYESYGGETSGIAISMPGMIDSDKGFCHTGGALAYNQGQPVAELLSQRCGCPVHIDNDGKCAAIAEHMSGSLRGFENGAVFLIGTGVGGGLILNGKLLRGKHFSAGEFSFLNMSLDEWDQLTSMVGFSCATTGLLSELRLALDISESESFDGKDAFRLINAGDERALAVFKKFTRMIAFQIYNFQMLLDIERVAIGGGISKQDIVLQGIQESFTELLETAFPATRELVSQTVEIVRCHYGSEANQVGALHSYLQWNQGGSNE